MCCTSACRRCSSGSLRCGRRILSLNSSGGDHAHGWSGTVMRLMFWARSAFLPTARQNCSTCTAPSCFRKFMKRKRRSCWARISFSSNFSTCVMRRSDQSFSEGQNYNSEFESLTDGFLLPTSVNFCRNGTRGDGGSVAGSGCRNTSQPISKLNNKRCQYRLVSTYWSVINKYQHQEVHSVLEAEDT